MTSCYLVVRFVFNVTATTEIYALSLLDALPISQPSSTQLVARAARTDTAPIGERSASAHNAGVACGSRSDRKRTRLNSSHANISDAAFCLKKTSTADAPPAGCCSHHA